MATKDDDKNVTVTGPHEDVDKDKSASSTDRAQAAKDKADDREAPVRTMPPDTAPRQQTGRIAGENAEEGEADPPLPPDYAVVGDQHLGHPVTLKATPPPLPGEQPTEAPDEINPTTGTRTVEKDQVRPGTTAAPVHDGTRVPAPEEKK